MTVRGRCFAVRLRLRLRRRQQGAALVCALVLMMVAMLVGVAACRAVFASIASAGAERERSLAHEAAEAALRDAERDIAAAYASADPARTAQFTDAGAGGFVAGCGRAGSGRGLCLAAFPPAWQVQDMAEPDNPAVLPYGHYTGASLATGRGLLPARPPAYLIEKITPPGAGESLGSFYRITAIGFGSRDSTRVVLQSVYRKPKPAPASGAGAPDGTGPPDGARPPDGDGAADPPGPADPDGPDAPGAGQGPSAGNQAGRGNGNGNAHPPPIGLPAGRISWREIANWPQLHAQALE
jgi:type IV pilus assembly protein PilX